MASPNTLTKQQKFRGGVWAVAFAAIIMVGTLTGAQLKSDKQKEQVSEFPNILDFIHGIAFLVEIFLTYPSVHQGVPPDYSQRTDRHAREAAKHSCRPKVSFAEEAGRLQGARPREAARAGEFQETIAQFVGSFYLEMGT